MQSKLLFGEKGSQFDKIAMPLIKKALCQNDKGEGCDCYSCSLTLSQHPDYRCYDKSSYSVEDVDEIVAYAESNPMIAPARVVYFKGFDTILPISQNKLLKELEDNKHFVMIATCNPSGVVLPTVRSRCQQLIVRKESESDFYAAVGDREDKELLYRITNGHSGLAGEIETQIPIFRNIEKAFSEKNSALLFESLSIVKDKDKGNYYEAYSDTIPLLYNFFGDLAAGDLELTKVIFEEKAKALSPWFKKIDFFTSIATIAEKLEGGKGNG